MKSRMYSGGIGYFPADYVQRNCVIQMNYTGMIPSRKPMALGLGKADLAAFPLGAQNRNNVIPLNYTRISYVFLAYYINRGYMLMTTGECPVPVTHDETAIALSRMALMQEHLPKWPCSCTI